MKKYVNDFTKIFLFCLLLCSCSGQKIKYIAYSELELQEDEVLNIVLEDIAPRFFGSKPQKLYATYYNRHFLYGETLDVLYLNIDVQESTEEVGFGVENSESNFINDDVKYRISPRRYHSDTVRDCDEGRCLQGSRSIEILVQGLNGLKCRLQTSLSFKFLLKGNEELNDKEQLQLISTEIENLTLENPLKDYAKRPWVKELIQKRIIKRGMKEVDARKALNVENKFPLERSNYSFYYDIRIKNGHIYDYKINY